jgi:hypothetical protein
VNGAPGREVGISDDAAAEPASGIAGLPGVHRLPDQVRVGEDDVALPGIEPHAAPAADAFAAPRGAARAEAGLQEARGNAKLGPVEGVDRVEAALQFGNALSRDGNVRGFSNHVEDVSIFKVTTFADRYRLRFEALAHPDYYESDPDLRIRVAFDKDARIARIPRSERLGETPS